MGGFASNMIIYSYIHVGKHSCAQDVSFRLDQSQENKICECTDRVKAALGSGITSLQMFFAFARSVDRGSNEAVTLLYAIP